MDSIDISDLAFSLSNFSAVSEVLSSATDVVPDVVSDVVPNVVPNVVPDVVSDVVSDVVPNVVSDVDSNFFLYLGIGLIIISIIGLCIYKYFINKNKHVHFQDNLENYYQQPPNNYQQSDF